MRFAYDDSYHMGLSMMLYKVLCDDHVGFFSNGQAQKSMKACHHETLIIGDGTERSVLIMKSQ